MNEELYESFEAYLNNQLSPEDRADFEARLQSDEKFAASFGEFQVMVEAIKLGAEEHLKKEIGAIHAEESAASSTPVVRFQPRRLLSAAAVLLVLVASGIIWQNSKGLDGPELYAEFVTEEQTPFISRGGDSWSEWKPFAEWLSKREYKLALAELNKAELAPKYLVDFYNGYCTLKSGGDPQEAIDRLKLVFETDNDFHAAAQWYQALAYLKMGDEESGHGQLRLLQNDNPNFRPTEVAELLSMLEE